MGPVGASTVRPSCGTLRQAAQWADPERGILEGDGWTVVIA